MTASSSLLLDIKANRLWSEYTISITYIATPKGGALWPLPTSTSAIASLFFHRSLTTHIMMIISLTRVRNVSQIIPITFCYA